MNFFPWPAVAVVLAVWLSQSSKVEAMGSDYGPSIQAIQDEQTEIRRLIDSEIKERNNLIEKRQRYLQTLGDQISQLQAVVNSTEVHLEKIRSALHLHSEQISTVLSLPTCAKVQQEKICTAYSRGITVPRLRFTKCLPLDTNGCDDVSTEDDGAIVTDTSQTRANWVSVRTDGLMMGRQYWEVKFSWTQISGLHEWRYVGSVGVRREGSDFGGFRGTDDQSWVVDFWYLFDKKVWEYRCRYNDETSFQSAQMTYEDNSVVSYRLGFLLEPATKTLTVVEANKSTRLCLFPNVKVDRRLVPVVAFGTHEFQRTFRLSDVDPSRLPEPVCSAADQQATGYQQITVPQLRFTEVYKLSGFRGEIDKEDDGKVVTDRADERADTVNVRTNGLMAGRKYWEVTLSWIQMSGRHESWNVGSIGARQSGSDFRNHPGGDNQSWAVAVWYSFEKNSWTYRCVHQYETLFESSPESYEQQSVVTNRLGFLLESANRTLTVIDVNNKAQLCTFSDISESQPLVPMVHFGSPFFQKAFQLYMVDPNRIPEPAKAILTSI